MKGIAPLMDGRDATQRRPVGALRRPYLLEMRKK
jgi:hypothetical protein